MSINEFIEKFKTDKAFAEKYTVLHDLDAILEQAKQDGYEIAKEDAKAALNDMRSRAKGELNESELASVTGGVDKDDLYECPECGYELKVGDLIFGCGSCGYFFWL